MFPRRSWLFGRFSDAFGKIRPQFDLQEWRAEGSDCDDFEELAVFYAHFLHRLQQGMERQRAKDQNEEPPEEAALAFGSFEYLIGGDKTRGHAINVAVIEEGTRATDPRLVFFEPQTGREVDISEGEIWSCLEIRF